MKDIIELSIGTTKSLAIDFSDDEHIEDLVVFGKGWNKFYPVLGAEAGKYQHGNDKDFERLTTEIHRNLQADSVHAIEVTIQNQELFIQGSYA